MKFRIILSGLFIAGLMLSPLKVLAAGNATLSLTPSSGRYAKGTTLSVSVYENSADQAVNTIQADLTYDSAKLQYVSLSTTGSSFKTCFSPVINKGSIKVTCAEMGGNLTGSQFVAKINFKVLARSGTTSIKFVDSSKIFTSTGNIDIWNHSGVVSGKYTLTAPKTKSVAPTSSQNNTPVVGQPSTTVGATTYEPVTTSSTYSSSDNSKDKKSESTLAATVSGPSQTTDLIKSSGNQTNWWLNILSIFVVIALIVSIRWRKIITAKTSMLVTHLKAASIK